MNKLNRDQVHGLINLVREKRGLYDKQHPYFKRLGWKDRTWKEIAKEINANEKDCKNAWRSLRDHFVKTLKDIKSQEHETDEDEIRVKYKNFDRLSFLIECVQLKQPSSNSTNVTEVLYEFEDHKDISSLEFETPFCSSTINIPVPAKSPLSGISEASANISEESGISSKRQKKSDDVTQIFSGFLTELVSQMKPHKTDNVDAFFQSVAATVKSFNLSKMEFTKFQCEVLEFVVDRLQSIEENKNK